ncbi:TetR/AcrR family transcriptional regulator [Nocardia sp. N2S4-5]|uniref:TetR/AcrR family transcriptional regulator n=1 Tax=Nocardia sp. N2S4-5 TaxID=3351565 RepID=UPI0037D1022F
MGSGDRPAGLSPRRRAICEAALDLAATGGNRAVTHHAVDARLGIARGSTSYYYRTRQDLLEAAITRLTEASREAFHIALDVPADGPEAPPRTNAPHRTEFLDHTAPLDRTDALTHAAGLIAGQLDRLLGDRRRDALARYALVPDAVGNESLRAALAVCLFSTPAAERLMDSLGSADSARAARDLVSLLEGLLFDRLHGARSLPGHGGDDLRPTVGLWLAALSGRTR